VVVEDVNPVQHGRGGGGLRPSGASGAGGARFTSVHQAQREPVTREDV
jgi:hypothetical protein